MTVDNVRTGASGMTPEEQGREREFEEWRGAHPTLRNKPQWKIIVNGLEGAGCGWMAVPLGHVVDEVVAAERATWLALLEQHDEYVVHAVPDGPEVRICRRREGWAVYQDCVEIHFLADPGAGVVFYDTFLEAYEVAMEHVVGMKRHPNVEKSKVEGRALDVGPLDLGPGEDR